MQDELNSLTLNDLAEDSAFTTTGNTVTDQIVEDDPTLDTSDIEDPKAYLNENSTKATYFNADGSTSGRPLEETLAEGDTYISGTGVPVYVDETAQSMDSVDTVSVDDASQGYTANPDVDQTPDQDSYDWQGTVPGEEMTASDAEMSSSPSDTAEQDPSLDGSGVVGSTSTTSSAGTSSSSSMTQMDSTSAAQSGAVGLILAVAGLIALIAGGRDD